MGNDMDIAINLLLAGIALAVTVILLKKQINLGLIMLMDTVFLAVLVRLPVMTALKYSFNGAVSDSTIKLILILFLIMMIENIMRNSGMIKSMVESLKEIVGSNRLAAAMMPTMLGLLPSPGGARFSCPMVEEITGDTTEDTNKSFINYWFRHIWLDAFILYPGIILAAELLKVSVISLFLHLVPFMLFTLIIGSIFGLSKVKKEEIHRTKPVAQSVKIFITGLLPIIVVIIIYISLLNVTGFSLEIASGAVMIVLLIIKRYSFKKLVQTVKEAFPLKLVLIIIGVMVFKEVLLESGAIDGLPAMMHTYGIPVAVLYILLPFIGAFTSGLTVSYVSLTFPILITLGIGNNLWFASVAYMAGYIGTMSTPLHLCAVMTADFFKTPLGSLLKRIAIAEIPLLVIIISLLFFIS